MIQRKSTYLVCIEVHVAHLARGDEVAEIVAIEQIQCRELRIASGNCLLYLVSFNFVQMAALHEGQSALA
jgi:hypothetical protein